MDDDWRACLRGRQAGPDHFIVPSVPAGEYLAVAVDCLERHEWTDVKNLESLRARATPVTLKAGEVVSVNLSVVK